MLLKNIPVLFDQDTWIKDYVSKNKHIIVQSINAQLNNFFFIDLTALPTKPVNYREVFVKWLIIVNRQRLSSGMELLCNYEVIKACPLWSVFPMPFKRATIESIGNTINKAPSKPSGSIGSKPTIKGIKSSRTRSINKSSKTK
jgi:hypothetical protein